MKSYNGNLEEISLPEEEKYLEDLMDEQISFIEEIIGKDESVIIRERAENLANVRMLSGDNYKVRYNGQENVLKSRGGAFNASMDQSFDGNKWTLTNGLYLRGDGIQNYKDTNALPHELFHALSTRNIMDFDENGIGYTKSGVSIVYYDKEDNEVDNSLKSKGLTEGITEMLAMKFSNQDKSQAYDFQTCIAEMLSVGNDSLIKAYFSDGDKEYKYFLKEFEERQSSLSARDLTSMETGQRLEQAYIENMIRGCSEYSLSYCQSKEELEGQKNKLYAVLGRMLQSTSIYTGKNDNREVFESTLEELISKREQELGERIQESTKNKESFNAPYGINETLVNQKVSLSNGRQISATQYIQEVVTPYIPENGKVKLKTGVEISARQYIEEFVFGEGQTKYNGDIEALINDTVELDDIPLEKEPDGSSGPGFGMSQSEVTYTHEEEQIGRDTNSMSNDVKDTLETPTRPMEHKANSFVNSFNNRSNAKNQLSNSFLKSLGSKREECQTGKSDVDNEMKAVANEQTLNKYKSLSFKSSVGTLSQEEQQRMAQLQHEQVVRDYMMQREQRMSANTMKKSQGMGMGR